MSSIKTKCTNSFFSKIDWIAFFTATIIAFTLYLFTLAPSVTLEDSGEMAVAADYLGVPHPPGYPLWTICGWLFTELLKPMKYLGHPNPAWAVSVMSAFFGALTAGLTAMLVSLFSRKTTFKYNENDSYGNKTKKFLAATSGVTAGLLMAFAPVPWSQSVIVEVYTMNAFFVLLQIAVAAIWMERPSNKLLYIMTLLFSISLTHYFYASFVNIIILTTVIWLKERKLFWEATSAALLLVALARFFQAFKKPAAVFMHHLSQSASWGTGKLDGLDPAVIDTMSKKCLPTIWAVIALVVLIITWTTTRFLNKQKGTPKILAIQWGSFLLCIAFAATLFTKAFRASTVKTYHVTPFLNDQIVDKKVGLVLSGVMIILIPIIIWAAQRTFYSKMKRTYVLSIVPPLFLLCFIAASSHFIDAIAVACRVEAGQSVSQSLGISTLAEYMFQFSILSVIAIIIWALRDSILKEWKRLLIMALILCGTWILIHLYLPWASDRNPPMNWGYPRTMEGFKHAVFRGQYSKVEPSDPLSTVGAHQSLLYLRLLFRQFTLPLALLGLIPFAAWGINIGKRRIKGTTLVLAAMVLLLPVYITTTLMRNFYDITTHPLITSYCSILITFIASCALAGLLAMILRPAIDWLRTIKKEKTVVILTLISTIISCFIVIALASCSAEDIRKSLALKAAISPTTHILYASELSINFAQGARLLFLLSGLAGLLAGLFILLNNLFKWAYSLKLSDTNKMYATLSIFPAVALLCIITMLSSMSVDTWFAFLKEPATKAHMLWAWITNPSGTETLVMGILPALLLTSALIFYIICCAIIALRTQSDESDNNTQPDGLYCSWEIDKTARDWMLITFHTFMGWGLIFACFANIKMDMQDIFIQRVKFLASYTVFSLWLGFGLFLITNKIIPSIVTKPKRIICGTSIIILLFLPIVPLLNNAYNRELVSSVGGAEQCGHDFGWQFGNYQLRGADAICEELTQEEPLPNPLYPEEMTHDAIFFGGTDPGRFVPTYMIYSADVRSDVYLITQNALADNTYMNVMRDLYGDDIWIPAQPDSAIAFQRYVNEVRSGKRPQNAELVITGGRVQISGALGVMEINGILAQMIFERNNYKHDFYVEESYVIKWMYPYITPHGLIMRINNEPTKYTEEDIRNDRDLWDWYTTRLLINPKFSRDVVAQKSFSKLRSALAGSYAYRGNMIMAEQAFHEARMLYPLSPEANFRLAQEVYLRQNRFDEAIDLVNDLQRRDMHSTRPQSFLNQIKNIKRLSLEIKTLEAEKNSGKIDISKAIRLASLYVQAGRQKDFHNIANNILRTEKFPVAVYLNIASLALNAKNTAIMNRALELSMLNTNAKTDKSIFLKVASLYARTKQIPQAEETLAIYLKKSPTDWQAFLDLASMQMMQKKSEEALIALQHAINYGGNEALKIISRDQRFQSISSKLKTNRPQTPLLNMGGRPQQRY